MAQFIAALGEACVDGEIEPASDLDQLAFEITAMLFRANFAWIMTEDKHVLNQARVGIRGVLDRVTVKIQESRKRQEQKKR